MEKKHTTKELSSVEDKLRVRQGHSVMEWPFFVALNSLHIRQHIASNLL